MASLLFSLNDQFSIEKKFLPYIFYFNLQNDKSSRLEITKENHTADASERLGILRCLLFERNTDE